MPADTAIESSLSESDAGQQASLSESDAGQQASLSESDAGQQESMSESDAGQQESDSYMSGALEVEQPEPKHKKGKKQIIKMLSSDEEEEDVVGSRRKGTPIKVEPQADPFHDVVLASGGDRKRKRGGGFLYR